MIFVCRWLLVVLMLAAGADSACGATAEEKRFQTTAKKMQLGLWDQVAEDFAAFITDFPSSSRVPEAVLYQAEAAITTGKYDRGIELLRTNLERAGDWQDAYLFWIGQAQLLNRDHASAAETFAALTDRFPESRHALEACIGQATAYGRMEQWPRVIELLHQPEGVFQSSATALTNRAVAQGYLLLGEAQLALTNNTAVAQALDVLNLQSLEPELTWRRAYLECRLHLADDRAREALTHTTNLIAMATAANNPRFRGESYLLQARVLEKLSALDEAVGVYQANLLTNVPAEHQRFALLKTSELRLAQGRASEAIASLEGFFNAHSNAPAADMALLALGELRLKSFLSSVETNRTAAVTNLLLQASNHFETVLSAYPDSALGGKALMGKGWCLWTVQQFGPSAEAFRAAAIRLPPSEDQAVARFKCADAQFRLRDFDGALTNYASLVSEYADHRGAREKFLELALYQSVRAALAVTNLVAAEESVRRILEWYPNGFAGDRSLLLLGEGYSRGQNPGRARARFAEFEQAFPSSDLLPEVRLAVARTYEHEQNWTAAITNYQVWTETFTNHPSVPTAEFSRAWDTDREGNSGQALTLFTNFVARWPTNELTPKAQWWIAEYHYRNGNWFAAEEFYQYIKTPELAFEARMMAGRAAVARFAYKDAISYFSNLVANPSCPVGVKVQAAFAAGDACVLRTEPGTTNRLDDLREAIRWFERVASLAPESASVPSALARTGDCLKEMGEPGLEEAVRNYRAAIAHTNATVATRSQARIALGVVAQKRAEQASGAEQMSLLKQALKHYTDVFVYNEALPEGEQPDAFALKEAGLKAARAAEQLQEWVSAEEIYRRLQRLFPPAAPAWDSRIAYVQQQQARQRQSAVE